MKHLLTSAAMALVLGTGAFAQTTTPTDDTTAAPEAQPAATDDAASTDGMGTGSIMADDLIGMQLYSTVGAEMAPVEGGVDPAEQGWEAIGEITDLVLSPDGNVEAVVVGVGGFLGIGEKNVALPLDQVNVYQDEDEPVLVVGMTQEELENAPDFVEGDMSTIAGTGAMTGAAATQDDAAMDDTAMDAEMPAEESTTGAVEETAEDADMTAPEGETETVDIQTPDAEDAPEADATAETEDDSAIDGAGAETAESSEVLEESEEATDLAQEDLVEDADTMVEEDTAMDEDAAVVDDMAETDTAADTDMTETDMTETDTAETDTAETDAMATEPAETDMPATDMAETDAETDTLVAEPVEGETAADAPMLGRPMMEREGYTESAVTDLTVEDLTGSNVYGIEDEDIGTIADLVVGADGTVTDAVINFGGFLGLGQTAVLVSFDDLQILANEDGSDIRVYMEASQEELEAMPEYTE